MEVCQERIRNAEAVSGFDSEDGFTSTCIDFVICRGGLERSQRRCADGDHSAALPLCLVDHFGGCFANLKTFAANEMFFHLFNSYGFESPIPYVKRNLSHLCTGFHS